MEILYNSKDKYYKFPFGCLRENEKCTLTIEIPKETDIIHIKLIIYNEDGFSMLVPLKHTDIRDRYNIYSSEFSLFKKGLYFYKFNVCTKDGDFEVFKNGDGASVGNGSPWQLTCYDKDYDTPDDFKGKVMYQIFPDRFFKSGEYDLEDKLKPYTIHTDMNDIPFYKPDEHGKILNNDFFGGNLKGIEEKLLYISELGAKVIYLNPIFYAFSNHRYDTADYKKIDSMLGTEKDFISLCKSAHNLGMKVILDGVFSHTGSNSVYFDKEGIFGNGAVSDENSPYKDWYTFQNYPYQYTSWWGIDTLPCVNEMEKSYMDYIIFGKDSVLEHWLTLGADGFRLDVADELPDDFICAFKKRLKEIKPDALLIGEVWEDASNKISYGIRRKYLLGEELDSVMNYPFKNCILNFVKGHISGFEFAKNVMDIAENYPKPIMDCTMNLLSTHDTKRALTFLSGANDNTSKDEKAHFTLERAEFSRAISLMKCASILQFTLPGSPCIYYGDEIGMQGFEDPFNRGYFKWQDTECDLHLFYKKLAKLKNNNKPLQVGDISVCHADNRYIKFSRSLGNETIFTEILFGGEIAHRDNELFSYRTDIVNAVVVKE